MEKDHYHKNIYIILLLLIALIIRCHQITIPFIDAMATDGTSVGNLTRNFLRYSVFETKFGIVNNVGPVIDGNFSYAIDHPMLLFVSILSVFYRIFGIHEWSVRLVAILFSMGNLIMIYILAYRLWDKKTALFSLCFLVFMPMTAFYATRDVWPYSMGIFLSLVVIWFYVSWVREYKLKYFYGAIIIYSVSLFTLWDIYFLGPILFVYHVFSKKEKVKLMLFFPMLNFFVFTLILMHVYIIVGSLEQLWNLFILRSGATKNVTFFQFLSFEFYNCLKYFTLIPCILAVMGIWNEISNGQNKDPGNKLMLFLFSWGIPFSLLLREGAMHQTYWICTLSPFLALSGARGLIFLQESIFPEIKSKNFGKRFLLSLSFIALMGCIFLAFHKSTQPNIGPYSWFFLKIYIIFIALTSGLILFTWKMFKDPSQEFLKLTHPVTLILLFVFLVQSFFVIYNLHQERNFRLDYTLAKTINENTEFEDAIVTSIDLYRYHFPYYADRYVVTHLRTKDDYLEVLKRDKERSFKYYITTDWELMKMVYLKDNKISESTGNYLKSKGITEEPCELDAYISKNHMGKVIGPLIFYDLTIEKASY